MNPLGGVAWVAMLDVHQDRTSRYRTIGGAELALTTWQILTVAFDDFSDFEMNATCFQVRHDPYATSPEPS